jgi:hypothetical protein
MSDVNFLLEKICEDIKEIKEDYKEMRKILSGDNGAGLCEKVRNNEDKIKNIWFEISGMKNRPKSVLQMIVLIGRSVSSLIVILAAIGVILNKFNFLQ